VDRVPRRPGVVVAGRVGRGAVVVYLAVAVAREGQEHRGPVLLAVRRGVQTAGGAGGDLAGGQRGGVLAAPGGPRPAGRLSSVAAAVAGGDGAADTGPVDLGARVLMARRPLAAHGSKRVVSARRLWLPAQPEGEGRVPADRRCPRVRYQSVGRVIQGLMAPPDRPGSSWPRAPGAPSVLPVTWAASPSPSAKSVCCFKGVTPRRRTQTHRRGRGGGGECP
jgi:hypothetical protein